MEENIKKAFSKVKEDIFFLNKEIFEIKNSLAQLDLTLNNYLNKQENNRKITKTTENTTKTTENNSSTIQQINPTDPAIPTHFPTHQQLIQDLKSQNLGISIGNQGDPTDKQTNRQTDNPTHFLTKNTINTNINNINTANSIESGIKKAEEILNSLDAIKKEIRLKFKHLTNQEMLVFSSIYQLEQSEENKEITYKILAKMLALSESSIRDYINKIINKGIPIKKHKVNNKKILLSISPELKKIASLSTIIKLREL